jgi:hypothetical protein
MRIGTLELVSFMQWSDLMTGAGFYLTATDPKWRKHYNMYDLVVKELPAVLKEADLGLDISRMSIMGHSMGGTHTNNGGADNRPRRSFLIPQKPRPVQVCISIRTCLQPLYDPLGQESIWQLHQPHHPINAACRMGQLRFISSARQV